MSRFSNLLSVTILNLLLPKWQPFQYNTKVRKNVIFPNVLTRFFLKCLEKNCLFQYKFAKFMSQCIALQTFRILNFLLLKQRPFQFNVTFETNTSFINVLTRFLSKFYDKTVNFEYKVSKCISRLVFHEDLPSQIFCY